MDAYQNYINLNKTIYKKTKDAFKGEGLILVDLQTTNEFFASCVMKLAANIRSIKEYNLLVVNARKPGKRISQIVNSYKPASCTTVGRMMIVGFIMNILRICKKMLTIKTGATLESMTCEGIPFGMHIYDSILRRMGLPTLDRLTIRQRLLVLMELAYYYGLKRIMRRSCVKYMLLPDNAYRAGIAFEYAKKSSIPSMVGIDLNGMSIHKYDCAKDYELHCRTPDIEILDAVEMDPLALQKADEYLEKRTTGRETQHDVMRAYSNEKKYVTKDELRNIYNIDHAKKIVLVAAHVFCDAPHAHPGMLFKDYEDWLIKTCDRLLLNANVGILVKEHPSAGLYGEDGAVEVAFKKYSVSVNILPNDINTRSLLSCVDVLVTCGGTAGMEFPCFGVPVVVAARPPYYRERYIKNSNSIDEYYSKLDSIHKYHPLSEQEIRRAKANLYVIQDVIKVRRDKLGLGSQAFYMGCKIDYDKHYSELCDSMRNAVGSDALNKTMSEFIQGTYKNLIDPAKITPKI